MTHADANTFIYTATIYSNKCILIAYVIYDFTYILYTHLTQMRMGVGVGVGVGVNTLNCICFIVWVRYFVWNFNG